MAKAFFRVSLFVYNTTVTTIAAFREYATDSTKNRSRVGFLLPPLYYYSSAVMTTLSQYSTYFVLLLWPLATKLLSLSESVMWYSSRLRLFCCCCRDLILLPFTTQLPRLPRIVSWPLRECQFGHGGQKYSAAECHRLLRDVLLYLCRLGIFTP